MTALNNDTANIIDAILKRVQKDSESAAISGITDEPGGIKQDDSVFGYCYVDQHSIADFGDAFEGSVYYPVEDGRFVKCDFVS